MKKYILISLVLFCFNGILTAQVAKWVVPAEFDSISPCIDNNFYLVSSGGKFGIMNPGPFNDPEEMEKESLVLSVDYDSIAPFRNGYAVVFDRRNDIVKGVIKQENKNARSKNSKRFVDLSSKNYRIKSGFPYVSEGFLLVILPNYDYFYVDIEDPDYHVLGPFYEARPFFNGLACVREFEDRDKRKPGRIGYLKTDGNMKEFLSLPDPAKFNFVSSVSKGKSLISYGKRFYEYYLNGDSVSALVTDPTNPKKTQVRAEDKDVFTELLPGGRENVVYIKNGELLFDQYMRLKKAVLPGLDTLRYEIDEYIAPHYDQILRMNEDRSQRPNKFGINFLYTDFFGVKDYHELLPPQFEEVRLVRADEAIVKLKGKYGVIKADSTLAFGIKIAPGKDVEDIRDNFVEFSHGSLRTDIKIVYPWVIPNGQGNNATVVIPASDDCNVPIDMLKDASNGITNGYEGKCELKVPQDLGVDEFRTHIYEFFLNYQGLVSSSIKVPVIQCFSPTFMADKIEGIEDKYSAPEEKLTVNFGVFQRDEGDKVYLSRNVTVKTPEESGLIVEETTLESNNGVYTAVIHGVQRDQTVNYNVEVRERDCPPVVFPFTARAEVKEVKKELTEDEVINKVKEQEKKSSNKQKVIQNRRITNVDNKIEQERKRQAKVVEEYNKRWNRSIGGGGRVKR